jgi:hypothetical protein
MSTTAKARSLGKRILKLALIVVALGTGTSAAAADLRPDESLRSNTDDPTAELVRLPRRHSISLPLPHNEVNESSSPAEYAPGPDTLQSGEGPIAPYLCAWETATAYGVGSFASTALGSSASVALHT